MRSSAFALVATLALGVVLCFLALPVIAIFVDVGPAELLASLDDPVALDALQLSLITSVAALLLIVVLGTPAAWLLATRSFRGRSLIVTVIELPLILPPAVAGIGLLAALGPKGLIGPQLEAIGIVLPLTTAAVIIALTFVASPFYLRAAQAAFESMDPNLIAASRVLGASEARTFWRVGLPAARQGLLTGGALSWGRALGEFGATLMFAGSFQGVTQTVPLAIYNRFSSDFPAALALSAVLVCASAAILLAMKLFDRAPQSGVLNARG